MNYSFCLFCELKIPEERRADAKFCSDTCRESLSKRNQRERKGLATDKSRGPYKIARKDYISKRERVNHNSKVVQKAKLAARPEGNSTRERARKKGFRSGFEERIYENALAKDRELEYEPERPRITYSIPYLYRPDFVLPNGIIVEAKGWLRPRDRTKMRKIKEQNPSLDIRFLFQNANARLTKSKNSEQYWQWAERLGFGWSQGEHIPLSWWEEEIYENI